MGVLQQYLILQQIDDGIEHSTVCEVGSVPRKQIPRVQLAFYV